MNGPRFLPVVVAALCSGCFSVGYMREVRESAPAPARVESLAEGVTGLSDVLGALGAPLYVWEGAGGGVVLAYGGLRTRQWGFEVSVPVADSGSASFAYDDAIARTLGHVLVFDADLRLSIVRAGNLADLRRTFARRRPASIGEGEEGEEGPRGAEEREP